MVTVAGHQGPTEAKWLDANVPVAAVLVVLAPKPSICGLFVSRSRFVQASAADAGRGELLADPALAGPGFGAGQGAALLGQLLRG